MSGNAGTNRRRDTRAEQPVMTERGRTVLRRKYGAEEMSDARGITRARLLSRFVNELASRRFGAVVFAYEDTLLNMTGDHTGHTMPLKEIAHGIERLQRGGVIVGIVTGMDWESAREKIRHVVMPEYWESTYVGCSSGADIRMLDGGGSIHNGDRIGIAPDSDKKQTVHHIESFLQTVGHDCVE